MLCVALSFVAHIADASPSLGLYEEIISSVPLKGSLPLVANGTAATIFVDGDDYSGVRRVATDLQTDISRVTNVQPKLVTTDTVTEKLAVVVVH